MMLMFFMMSLTPGIDSSAKSPPDSRFEGDGRQGIPFSYPQGSARKNL